MRARAAAASGRRRGAAQAAGNWLADIDDFGVWLTGSVPATVAATGYDMVVVDPDEQTAQDVADMHAMPGGGTRRLVAYLSVSEAVDYRWYWQAAWNTTPPSWLGVQNGPGWYRVQYWTQDWKNLLYANGATSSVGRILAAGFDGVYLAGADAYETWAGEGRATAEAEMVALVGALSTYAKSVNPDFKVVPANADALLMRSDYLSSIDGALRVAVRYDEAGAPRTQGDLDWILPKLANAKSAGKKILTVEFTGDQAEIDAAYAANGPLGYLTHAAPAALDALWTRAPSNWMASRTAYGVWLSGSDPAVIAASSYDLMTVDPDEQTTAEITQMQAMPGGGRRYLIAYLSVGEAGTYRSYWNPAWSTTPPSWLGPENPAWPGDYRVRYWEAEWQNMLFRDGASSHLGQILAKGFDGVFYDVVDTYQYWQDQGRATAADEMVDMLADMYAYAKSVNPNFQVVAQNADDLLLRADYLAAIDAVSKESLWFYEGVAWTGVDRQWLDTRAASARAAGKRILSIEYVTDQAQINTAFANSNANGDLLYIGPVSLNALWTRGPTQSAANWLNDRTRYGVWLTMSDPAVIAASPYDLMTVDPDEQTAAEMTQMQAMSGGGRRRLLAYLSVGEAVNYRWYWQAAWNTTPPSWLGTPNPSWPDAYRVQYWNMEWQNLLFRNGASSSLGRILAAGFDGVFYDVVDTYVHWQEGGRATAADEMVDMLADMHAYAKSVNPDFKIVAQNADDLLLRADYLAAIDGVSKESLWFNEGTPWTAGDRAWLDPRANNARSNGKRIFTIEYITDQAQINQAFANSNAAGDLLYIAPHALDVLWTRVAT